MAEQTVTTAAVGRTSAPPDEAELRFAADAIDPDVTGARRAVAEQATLLRQVLDETGIPEEQIRTDRFRIRRRPPDRGDEPEREVRSYHATETISVTLLDLDRLGEALAAAVDKAEVEIDEVAFAFRTETARELQREAIADAVRTARRKATAAAAAEELAVGGVRSIVTDDGPRPRRTSAVRFKAKGSDESGSIESGPMEVQVRVEVEYELGEA